MAKSKTDSDIADLPESTIWARAVALGTAVLGITLTDRALNAKNVDRLGRRAREIAFTLGSTLEALIEELHTRLVATGGKLDCDRLRTARCAHALLQSIATQKSEAIVEYLANTRLETSSSAVQSTLATATDSLETLRDAIVIRTLTCLAELERTDLSAAKYLREARTILQQDETRRSLPFELRMVIGSAEAYLSTGKQSMLGATAFESTQDLDFATPAPSTVTSLVMPTDVVIESKQRPTPPPSQPKPMTSKRNALLQTLISENAPVRINVERKGTGLDRAGARALLNEAMKEAAERIDKSSAPMLVTVVLTLDVSRE